MRRSLQGLVPRCFQRFALGSRSTPWWMILAFVWVVTALSAWHRLDHGWIPHDEGTLAQSAERVLGGQTPPSDLLDSLAARYPLAVRRFDSVRRLSCLL